MIFKRKEKEHVRLRRIALHVINLRKPNRSKRLAKIHFEEILERCEQTAKNGGTRDYFEYPKGDISSEYRVEGEIDYILLKSVHKRLHVLLRKEFKQVTSRVDGVFHIYW